MIQVKGYTLIYDGRTYWQASMKANYRFRIIYWLTIYNLFILWLSY